jgi:hypothetical protein
VGIVIVDKGAAIVTLERDEADAIVVTAIERLPFDLRAVTRRVRELTEDGTEYVIDHDGLGNALWAVLGHQGERDWALYTGRGVERQALVDNLLVAVEQDRFHFAAGLAEQPAMNEALTRYRRQVRDDGLIGSELVVALLLAIYQAPKPPTVGFIPLDDFEDERGWHPWSPGAR